MSIAKTEIFENKRRGRGARIISILLVAAICLSISAAPILAAESYSFVTKWGTNGTGDGQLFHPIGTAVDASGNVYVADSGNHRIQKFSSTGAFITKWGEPGTGDGQFNNPIGIAVDTNGNIFVADSYNHRIQKFSSTGAFITKWGEPGTGDGQFNTPYDVAVDASGNVYATDFSNNRIQKFTSTGTFITSEGIAGTGDGQYNMPTGIAVDTNGNIYVADTGNSRIQKLSQNGIVITKWGSAGVGDGQFNALVGVDVDSSGNVYVADSVNNRIQKFTSTGTFTTKWGSAGTGDGQFDNPYDVAVDASGNVYAVDSINNRIQKFRLAGTSGAGISVSANVAEQPAPSLTFSISAGTTPTGGSITDTLLDFGTLTPGAPKTATQHLSITTDATNGYSVTVGEDHPLSSGTNQIADVSGDTAGITEVVAGAWANATTYGFGYSLANITGIDAAFTADYKQFANQAASETPQQIMGNTAPVTGSQVDITYKVNIAQTQPVGTYTNTISYIATSNF